MTSFIAELFGSATLRARYGRELQSAAGERVGRALGTLILRRGLGEGPIVVGRGPHAAAALRDDLVRGLVLTGRDVRDAGVVAPELFTFAMKHEHAVAGLLVNGDENDPELAVVIFFIGGAPLVAQGLLALANLADQGDFACGAGTLSLISIEDSHRRARAREAAIENAALAEDTLTE